MSRPRPLHRVRHVTRWYTDRYDLGLAVAAPVCFGLTCPVIPAIAATITVWTLQWVIAVQREDIAREWLAWRVELRRADMWHAKYEAIVTGEEVDA